MLQYTEQYFTAIIQPLGNPTSQGVEHIAHKIHFLKEHEKHCLYKHQCNLSLKIIQTLTGANKPGETDRRRNPHTAHAQY